MCYRAKYGSSAVPLRYPCEISIEDFAFLQRPIVRGMSARKLIISSLSSCRFIESQLELLERATTNDYIEFMQHVQWDFSQPIEAVLTVRHQRESR